MIILFLWNCDKLWLGALGHATPLEAFSSVCQKNPDVLGISYKKLKLQLKFSLPFEQQVSFLVSGKESIIRQGLLEETLEKLPMWAGPDW